MAKPAPRGSACDSVGAVVGVGVRGRSGIANSYGAYLTLLALFDRPPLKTSVLLLSPVLGKTFLRGTYIRPPGGRRFAAAISSPAPKPAWLGLVMGAEDPGYVPETWGKLVAALQPDHIGWLRRRLVCEVGIRGCMLLGRAASCVGSGEPI